MSMTREQLIENARNRRAVYARSKRTKRKPLTYVLFAALMLAACMLAYSEVVPVWAEYRASMQPSTLNTTITNADGSVSSKSYVMGDKGWVETKPDKLVIEPPKTLEVETSGIFEVSAGDVTLFVDITKNIEMEGYTVLLRHPVEDSFSSTIITEEEFMKHKELFDSLQHGDSISWDDERNFTLVKKSKTRETFDQLEKDLEKLRKKRPVQHRVNGATMA